MSPTNPPPKRAPRRESTLPPAWRRRAEKAPPADRVESDKADNDESSIQLRLAIGRGGLGLELGRAASLGCLEVTELVVALPAARFPLDVSGGVGRFRHQRGLLRRASVELSAAKLKRWAKRALMGIVGVNDADVWIGVRPWGASFCIHSGGDRPTRDAPRVLAFDVSVSTFGEDVSFVVSGARGRGLPKPATALAMSALGAMVSSFSTRQGARFVTSGAITRIARALFPEAGARAPETEGIRVTAFAAAQDAWILHASAEGTACEPSDVSTRDLEAAALTLAADEARAEGNYDKARALDVATLERAPRHPGIAGRIAEIDAFVGGRAEAALSTLMEAERGPMASYLGFLRAELLAETNDVRGAIAAFERTGEEELAPALAASAFERASELCEDRLDALGWLDRAVARAPQISRLRWARVAGRLSLGRIEDAMADVEHLEAQAKGPKARYAVFFRAGAIWQEEGLYAEAAPLFERALRFLPDDASSLAGLGRALLSRGRTARAVSLLTRALSLLDAKNVDAADVRIDLARALAEKMDDRPAAIAHVRSVRHDCEGAAQARALEGKWRAELGDVAGASLAYARLRDHAETMAEVHPSTLAGAALRADSAAREKVARLLLEAAAFERDTRSDRLAAQRHVAAALRLRPNDPAVLAAYRAAHVVPAPPAPSVPRALIIPASVPPMLEPQRMSSVPPPRESMSPAFSPDDFANMEEEPSLHSLPRLLDSDAPESFEDEARVEELTRRLQLDPTQDDVVDELCTRLLRLGRSHELFALLAARLEDASPERRASLIPKQREVLQRLEDDARSRGSDAEAGLYAMARNALEA